MKKVIDPYKSDDVLNIFCDASIKKEGKNRYTGCYCAIAVVGDQIIDTICNIVSETTNNNAEIKGVRAGVILADRYKGKYKITNLFSDSQISIFGMRDRIMTWLVQGDNLYGSSNQVISSGSIYIEIMKIIIENKLEINFWHQKGHVTRTEESLNQAAHVFMASNNLRRPVNMKFISYISHFNDIVDKSSRYKLDKSNCIYQRFIDPLLFYPVNFYGMVNEYIKVVRSGN